MSVTVLVADKFLLMVMMVYELYVKLQKILAIRQEICYNNVTKQPLFHHDTLSKRRESDKKKCLQAAARHGMILWGMMKTGRHCCGFSWSAHGAQPE